jgi:hypothetical protein
MAYRLSCWSWEALRGADAARLARTLAYDLGALHVVTLREAAHGDRFVVEQVKHRGELGDDEQVVDALGGVQ